MAPDTLNASYAADQVLFQHEVSIRDSAGSAYSVLTLTRDLAIRHSTEILRIHRSIPNVTAWSEADILAEGSEGREYLHKWQVSAIVIDPATRSLIGFLIAYFRCACQGHPFDGVYIHRMAIDERYQRRRIGTNLLNTFLSALHLAIPWLRVVSVQTNDDEGNLGVLQFYESSGFRRVARVHYAWKTDWLLWMDILHRDQARIVGQLQAVPVLVTHPHLCQSVDGCPVLFLSTSNPRKFAELDFLFACYNFQIVRISPPTELTEPQVEISDPDFESELVRHPLTIAAKFVEKETVPFVVEDTMLFIEFFNRNYRDEPELPGYDTKRWWRQLGCDGVLSLMKGSSRRQAKYVSQIGAYLGNRQYLIGRGEVPGTITLESRISDQAKAAVPITSPWFFHSIFVPDGATRTLAEMGPEEFVTFDYKRRAVEQFLGKIRSTAMAFRINAPLQLALPLE